MIPRETKKLRFFPKGPTWPKILVTILYSITKEISKIYQLEREQWLSKVLQKHQSSVIYSFIFIHSLMSGNDKNGSFLNFTQNEVRETHLVFSKEVISRFHIRNFESGRSLGEKFTFFNSLGTTKVSRSLRLSVYISVVLLMNFSEQFELCFYFKYSRNYKVL